MTASNRLDGKVAIVTGGGRGLGRAMALGLATAGARVTVTSTRMPDEIAAVAKEAGGASNMLSIVADVARPEDCLRVVAETERRFGPVDILVNNAGRGMRFVSERFMTEPTRFWRSTKMFGPAKDDG